MQFLCLHDEHRKLFFVRVDLIGAVFPDPDHYGITVIGINGSEEGCLCSESVEDVMRLLKSVKDVRFFD